MARNETKRLKAIYFDMHIKSLERYYSSTDPKGAYKKIMAFMLKNGFSHEQYSGYHSLSKMTDMEVFDLVYAMNKEFPWLKFCMNRFEVTNIGANHDLMAVFDTDIDL
ncbi:MAG: hypothetical protein K6G24_07825 [Lachnospiraceae bacterium]|nr:hypothetical protein [Lachnospiraceae bacterium]